jgi:hypothetical protein
MGDEMATAEGEPLLVLRTIRLTADQGRQLASTLNDLVASLDDAGDGAARYGVLVGLYQPRPPGPDGSSSP